MAMVFSKLYISLSVSDIRETLGIDKNVFDLSNSVCVLKSLMCLL